MSRLLDTRTLTYSVTGLGAANNDAVLDLGADAQILGITATAEVVAKAGGWDRTIKIFGYTSGGTQPAAAARMFFADNQVLETPNGASGVGVVAGDRLTAFAETIGTSGNPGERAATSGATLYGRWLFIRVEGTGGTVGTIDVDVTVTTWGRQGTAKITKII